MPVIIVSYHNGGKEIKCPKDDCYPHVFLVCGIVILFLLFLMWISRK